MEDFKYCQPSQLYHSSLQLRNQQQQQHQTQHLIQQLGLPSQLQGANQYSFNSGSNNQSPNQIKNSNTNLDWGSGQANNDVQNSNNSNININYANQNLNSTTNSDYPGMKPNNLITNSDGSTLVSLVPAKMSSSMQVSSSSPPLPSNLSSMLQQVVPSNGHMMNVLSPSKPSNISELSNSSMVSSSSNSSTLDSTNGTPTTKRSRKSPDNAFSKGDIQKDGKYFERRKRNNVAAKKSRDARKQREDEIAIRASFLEKENSILKAQLQTLKDEAQQLRMLLSQKKSNSLQNQSNCSNCSNCSSNGNKSNGHSMNNNNGYLSNPNLNGLGYDHNDLEVKSSQNATASLYLQHQNQHRHPIL